MVWTRTLDLPFWAGLILVHLFFSLPSMAGPNENHPPLGSELFLLEEDDPGRLSPLEGSAAPPVSFMDGYALAWGTPGSAEEIRALGLEVRILTPRDPSLCYSVFYPPRQVGEGDRPASSLRPWARILWRGPHTWVIEHPPDRAEEIRREGFLISIPDRPIHWPAAAAKLPSFSDLRPDPVIARYLSQVDSLNLVDIIGDLQNFSNRRSDQPDGVEASNDIAQRFRAYGLQDVTFQDYNAWCDNVVAVQPGVVAPGEIYIICGHYDSYSRTGLAPGADDNATGTAAVLEAARIFADQSFESTIIYLAFSGEEQGLVGAENWVRWAFGQGYDIRGVINLDMVGWCRPGDLPDLDVISNEISTPLRDLTEAVIRAYLPEFSMVDGHFSGGNSDQQPFWDAGYPAVTYHEDLDTQNPYYHTSGDVLGSSVNNISFLKKNVQTSVGVMATLARPLRISIDHTPLDDPAVNVVGYLVKAKIAGASPLAMDSLLVHFRINGLEMGPSRMRSLGSPDLYGASLSQQPAGTEVEYRISAWDTEGRIARHPFLGDDPWHHFVVGRVPVFEDSFTEDLGWTVGSPEDDASSGIWERGRPIGTGAQPGVDADADSMETCFFTGNGVPGQDPGESDVDDGQTTLTSPRIDLVGAMAVDVEYRRWFVDETNPDDTLSVYFSNDDGAHWVVLERVTESERAWKRVRHERADRLLAPTPEVRLRFTVADRGQRSLLEAAIDGVRIRAVYPLAVMPPFPVSAGPGLVRVWPSPAGGSLKILYDLPVDRSTRLLVFDAAGRRVARVDLPEAGRGRRQMSWNGSDQTGGLLPAGIYFLKLEGAPGSEQATRITLIR